MERDAEFTKYGVFPFLPGNATKQVVPKHGSRTTPAAPDPAALRGRLVEGRAKNALPAGLRVKIRRVR